jgi:tRNA-dihydrouridine synthase A
VRDFVGALFEAGCRVFIVHARNAWLQGLSPRENREVPPLRYGIVRRLKHDFPSATVVLNGGIQSLGAAAALLPGLDGVMLGRAAYHDPMVLAAVDQALFDPQASVPTRAAVVDAMTRYLVPQQTLGVQTRAVARHMLGLFQGERGARQWRRQLSDPAFLAQHGAQALFRAMPTAAASVRLAA